MKVGDLVCLNINKHSGSTVGIIVRDEHPHPSMGRELKDRVGVRWLDEDAGRISYEAVKWLRLLNESR